MKKSNKALIRMVMAAILWSLGGLLIKLVDWHPFAIAGGRSAIAAIVMMFYIGKPTVTLTKNKFWRLGLYWHTYLFC